MNTYPDPSTVSPLPIAVRYGLIGGLISIVIAMLSFILLPGMASGNILMFSLMGLLIMVLSIGVTIYVIRTGVIKHRNEELGGAISFGRAFIVSLIIILVMVVVSSAFNYLYTTLINPEYYNELADGMQISLEKMGTPEDQIESSVERLRIGAGKQIVKGLMINAVIGAVISLIAAAILKKDPQYEIE